ncbi:MAG: hypothetical protein GY714_25335 [Desulfobacterales bacterium]|nr:hypothetical protein [Desulfobacterales bacterium]MCP4161670.1 hypothetical protein [Deltaproteobacteria bacterium]
MMDKIYPWRIQKEYDGSGIKFTITIPDTNYSIERHFPFGDENKLEFNLIREFTEMIVGKFDDSNIIIDHICGRHENGKSFGTDIMRIKGLDISIQAISKDKQQNLKDLFSELIQKKINTKS